MANKVDLALLRHLRQNSREHLTIIGREYGIPMTTLIGSINRMQPGIVQKCTTLVDFSKLGFGIRAGFALQAKERPSRKKLEEFLMANKSTNNVMRLSGEHDFLVEGLFRNITELYLFEEELKKFGLSRFEEIHFVEELECESFVP